jgi:hypothetical protein
MNFKKLVDDVIIIYPHLEPALMDIYHVFVQAVEEGANIEEEEDLAITAMQQLVKIEETE